MEKIRVSPSTIKLSGRCEYAAALRLSKNPYTGERYKPHFGSGTEARLFQGIYFEAQVTNHPHDYHAEGDKGMRYKAWLDNASSEVLEKLDYFADYVRKYLRLDEDHAVQKTLEFEFDDFVLNGILDYMGLVDNNSRLNPLVFTAIADLKLTADIDIVWTAAGGAHKEQFIQTPIYALLHALNSNPDTAHLFKQAAAFMNQGMLEKALDLVTQWEKTVEILMSTYIICESKDTPYLDPLDRSKGKWPPLVSFKPIRHGAHQLLNLYVTIQRKVQTWNFMRSFGRYYSPDLAKLKFAKEHSCLGKGRTLDQKGRCPMLAYCPYGRQFIAGSSEPVDLDDILNST